MIKLCNVTAVSINGIDLTPYIASVQLAEDDEQPVTIPVEANTTYWLEAGIVEDLPNGIGYALIAPPEPTYPYPNRAIRRARKRSRRQK